MATKRTSLYLACAFATVTAIAGSPQAAAVPASNPNANKTWLATATHAHELRADSSVLGISRNTMPVHIEVALRLQNRELLDSFIANQQNPTHFFYKETLQPEDTTAVFSPSAEQAQAVVDHLRSSGFTNIDVSANRLFVSADGSAASVLSAFQARLADVATGNGEKRFANIDEVKVPASLSGTVLAVLGLQTESHAHSMAKPGPGLNGKPTPPASGIVGHNPTAFASIYNTGGTPTASSVTVGIIAEGNLTTTLSDLNKFTTNNGLPAVNVQTVVVGGSSTDTSGTAEWDLDSQDIIGVSGGVAKLVFYDAHSLFDSDLTPTYNKAVTDNVAKVINISLGECETSASNSGTMAADDQIFALGVSHGQTFSVSSGDSGANECGGHGKGTTPSYPASSPYVVAVGGTTLTTSGSGNTTWSKETVWSGTGGSPSLVEPKPSWQTTGTGTKRGVPDIAFDADPNSGAILVLNGGSAQYGGTSLSAPLFAGLWARALAGKPSLGFAAPHLYAVPSSVYHDVTSGSNGGFSATAGWDYTTGFGSFIFSAAYTAL